MNFLGMQDESQTREALAWGPVAAGQRLLRQVATLDATTISYFGALAVIGVISAHDAYLVKLYGSWVREYDPVCAMLIAWDPVRLSYFFLAKAIGTMSALGILIFLFSWRRRLAIPVVFGVTIFQIGLLIFLNTGQ